MLAEEETQEMARKRKGNKRNQNIGKAVMMFMTKPIKGAFRSMGEVANSPSQTALKDALRVWGVRYGVAGAAAVASGVGVAATTGNPVLSWIAAGAVGEAAANRVRQWQTSSVEVPIAGKKETDATEKGQLTFLMDGAKVTIPQDSQLYQDLVQGRKEPGQAVLDFVSQPLKDVQGFGRSINEEKANPGSKAVEGAFKRFGARIGLGGAGAVVSGLAFGALTGTVGPAGFVGGAVGKWSARKVRQWQTASVEMALKGDAQAAGNVVEPTFVEEGIKFKIGKDSELYEELLTLTGRRPTGRSKKEAEAEATAEASAEAEAAPATPEEAEPTFASQDAEAQPAEAQPAEVTPAEGADVEPKAEANAPEAGPPEADSQPEIAATEAARKAIEEQGLDANQITATGKGGRITKKDVQTFIRGQARDGAPKAGDAGTPGTDGGPAGQPPEAPRAANPGM